MVPCITRQRRHDGPQPAVQPDSYACVPPCTSYLARHASTVVQQVRSTRVFDLACAVRAGQPRTHLRTVAMACGLASTWVVEVGDSLCGSRRGGEFAPLRSPHSQPVIGQFHSTSFVRFSRVSYAENAAAVSNHSLQQCLGEVARRTVQVQFAHQWALQRPF